MLLEEDSINVQLTSTLRCGYHQYSFTPTKTATIVFDLQKANNRVDSFGISFENNYQIKGYQQTEETGVYFFAEFERSFENAFVYTDNHWELIRNPENFAQKNHLIAVQFNCMDNNELGLKIGLSFVSTKQAEMNLGHEIRDWNFDKIRNEAEQTWEALLSRIRVEGGTKKDRIIFYTSLYRAFLWPALRSDVDGSYRDINGNISKTNRNYYSLPSLWDTFRNKLILLCILDPDLTEDIIQSMVDMGNKSGYMPVFFHGDFAAAFISGAYNRGLRNFDMADAYRLLLKNATDPSGPREFLDEYIHRGYISTQGLANPDVESKGSAGVAKTLEYAYCDYSLGLLGMSLGDSVMAETLFNRSMNYKNVFDSNTGFMRGRKKTGEWISPFNPDYPYYEYMYREANAWQQTFFVPHDIPGLLDLFGGPRPFEEKLDSMFTLKWDPDYIARNICCFIGQYCHGNQPDHHVPFLYYFINKPWKSQSVINRIQSMYGIGDHNLALPGMDDTGEMSSWYVFTSMGFYPFSPADPEYILSIPKFPEIEIILENNVTLSLRRKTAGLDSLVQVTFNGRILDNYMLEHRDLMKGGVLDFYTE